METMSSIDEGLGIVSDLRNDGIDEWLASPIHDDDDWQYLDRVKAEDDFVTAALFHITDETSRNIIVSLLVESAVETFSSLTLTWSKSERDEVPAITEGIKRGREWMERNAAVRRMDMFKYTEGK